MRLHASSPTAFTGPSFTGTRPVCRRLNRSLHLERAFGLETPRPFLVFFDQNFTTLEWDIGRSKSLWAKGQRIGSSLVNDSQPSNLRLTGSQTPRLLFLLLSTGDWRGVGNLYVNDFGFIQSFIFLFKPCDGSVLIPPL